MFFLLSILLSSQAHAERYWALIGMDNTVQQVIVAEQEEITKRNGIWVETWMGDGGRRKNYAGIGYKYVPGKDHFVEPCPYSSWTLDDRTAKWSPPQAKPKDGKEYGWDEQEKAWKEEKRNPK